MKYSIEITPSTERQLKKLTPEVLVQISEVIEQLSVNPKPHGVIKLKGSQNLWRVRTGDFRVIYEVKDRELIVLIVKVAHRREVYR